MRFPRVGTPVLLTAWFRNDTGGSTIHSCNGELLAFSTMRRTHQSRGVPWGVEKVGSVFPQELQG